MHFIESELKQQEQLKELFEKIPVENAPRTSFNIYYI